MLFYIFILGQALELFLCSIIDCILFCAHSVNDIMIGTRLLPVAVNSYSTLIGTSGKTVRFTSPSASNICSVLDNTLVDISGICLANWLKRIEPFSFRMKTTNNAHLLPKRATTFRIGQISMIDFFLLFRHDNLLFFCISNLRVTLIHICNFLYCK